MAKRNTYRTYATLNGAQRYADKLTALAKAGQMGPADGTYTFTPCMEAWGFRYAVGMYEGTRFAAYCA